MAKAKAAAKTAADVTQSAPAAEAKGQNPDEKKIADLEAQVAEGIGRIQTLEEEVASQVSRSEHEEVLKANTALRNENEALRQQNEALRKQVPEAKPAESAFTAPPEFTPTEDHPDAERPNAVRWLAHNAEHLTGGVADLATYLKANIDDLPKTSSARELKFILGDRDQPTALIDAVDQAVHLYEQHRP